MTKRKTSPPRRLPEVESVLAIPESGEAEPGRIVERPDGFHWIALDGRQEFGPFETVALARADMLDAADEHAPQPGEDLAEAQAEIGIAEWIDPETGEPAEGACPPHLDEQ